MPGRWLSSSSNRFRCRFGPVFRSHGTPGPDGHTRPRNTGKLIQAITGDFIPLGLLTHDLHSKRQVTDGRALKLEKLLFSSSQNCAELRCTTCVLHPMLLLLAIIKYGLAPTKS